VLKSAAATGDLWQSFHVEDEHCVPVDRYDWR
jgi:hypothetical protein